jgi:hypothetical protein
MRTTDIIRSVLDLLDGVENSNSSDYDNDGRLDPHERDHAEEKPLLKSLDPDGDGDHDMDDHNAEQGEPVASRFRQIFAMLDNPSNGPLGNTPNEIVADVDSVTDCAGGGLNGPKHVDDIRVKDPRGYE